MNVDNWESMCRPLNLLCQRLSKGTKTFWFSYEHSIYNAICHICNEPIIHTSRFKYYDSSIEQHGLDHLKEYKLLVFI